jgi:hypothetical protein
VRASPLEAGLERGAISSGDSLEISKNRRSLRRRGHLRSEFARLPAVVQIGAR